MSDTDSFDNLNLEGIAVVGMAGRFPGAPNVDAFWRNLCDGVESITFFTDEELLAAGVDAARLESPDYVRARAVLDDVELFDAQFFGYSPREAEIIDPQHRIFLECAWEVLEDAGYDPGNFRGKIGVFAGTNASSYLLNNLFSNRAVLATAGGYQAMIGNDKDHLPTRVSYKLNLRGPSVNVQTACSTSLVAVHFACQSLLSYQADMVLAGGVSLALPQRIGYTYQQGGIASPDGHCRAFDARAQGTVGGSGCGLVLLKRLEDAIADRDHIRAVIKGSALNNDGSGKVGYTAPSVGGQAEVIAEAQALAGVSPEEIGYVEAHGTGTPLGDPIEVKALAQVFRAQTSRRAFCALGSVKTNVGHLDTAAGIAGLIKTTLSLQHGLIPPSLHFENPNPQLDYENLPFYVNTALAGWPSDGRPRRAGVSSFGIGGTNAHLVLEEAPQQPEPTRSPRPAQLLLLSARTGPALERAASNLEAYLRSHPEASLADVAFTLAVGRKAFGHRRAVACRDIDEALSGLTESTRGRAAAVQAAEAGRPVAFMFSGQGTQRVGMGRELYEAEAVFRRELDRCAELLRLELGLDLRDVLYPAEERREEAAERLRQTELTQPALFAFEYALAQQWMAWGVRPQAMIGHSIGEYVAACLAGVFTLEEALRVVAARGRLMQRLPAGAMLAVMTDEEQLAVWLEGRDGLSLAAVNAERQCVVSGEVGAVEEFERELATRGIGCKRLETSHAFHSAMMEPALEDFRREVERVQLQTPRLLWVSNVTGSWITPEEACDPDYWVRHLRRPVRFADGVGTLLKEKGRVLLEVGPGRALTALAALSPEKVREQVIVSSLGKPAVAGTGDETRQLLGAAGQLWAAGVELDWAGFYAAEQRRRVPLPTYPFERQRFWIEPSKQAEQVATDASKLSKKSDIADWFYVPVWKQSLAPVAPEPSELAADEKCWLVFMDEAGLGERLARRLEEGGQYVVSVRRGETFARRGERDYELGPSQASGYYRLLQELSAAGRAPRKIVHLWGVTSGAEARGGHEGFADAQQVGYYSLLALAQSLGAQATTDPVDICLVTDHLQRVTGEETLNPSKATALAPCKVIPQEYPHLRCRSIDVRLATAGVEETLAEQLLAELTSPTTETTIAYRGSDRWVEIFDAVRLDQRRKGRQRLREQGVYLITGGLGGVGLALAEALARAARAKLVLAGRAFVPPREQWDAWLEEHAEDDDTSRKIGKVRELESLGAEVMVVQADAADEAQMRAAVEHATERFGAVHGVIHAAGLVGQRWNSPVERTGRIESEKHFHAKVEGTLVLDRIFAERRPDFCVLVSSLSSILGGYGMAAYAAGNLFLDAFARSRRGRGGVEWISTNWDGWRTRETAGVRPGIGAGLAELEIRPGEGGDALLRLLSQTGATQVAISTADLAARISKWVEFAPRADEESAGETEAAPLHQRPDLQSDFVAPRNEVERTIADIWKALLGLDEVGIHDNFYELGGHSLAGIHLLFRLREAFQLPGLQLNKLIERPTVAGLAEAVNESSRSNVVLPNILVPLQPEGSKPPIFCVHPIGGDISGLIDLSRYMVPDQPFYAIQAPGIGDVANYGAFGSMEEMAAEYVEAIRFVSPDGPYFLSGFSYGGLVAFEMAHQLRRQGYEVPFIGMLDTPAPDNTAKVSQLDDATILLGLARQRARQHGTELRLTLADLSRLKTEDEQIGLIAEKLLETDILPPGLEERWIYNFIKGFRVRLDVAARYTPSKYDGIITMFLALDRDTEIETSYDRVMFDTQNPTLGWDELTTQPVEVLPVPGFHESIVREPHVRTLAREMRAAIDSALERLSRPLTEVVG